MTAAMFDEWEERVADDEPIDPGWWLLMSLIDADAESEGGCA